MLRTAIPRQRLAWAQLVRRGLATHTPPATPKPPGPSPPAGSQEPTLPATPKLPPDPVDVGSASPSTGGQPPKPVVTTPPPSPASIPPPPPSKPPKRRRRFRNFLLFTTITLGLGYAGGVYYSLVSDNFHDFFTEYIPFGEDAVLYFEEREFKRRYPDKTSAPPKLYPQVSGENKVKVAGNSGVSAKTAPAESSKQDMSGSKDRAVGPSAASDKPKPKAEDPAKASKRTPVPAAKKEDVAGKTDRAVAKSAQSEKKVTGVPPKSPTPASESPKPSATVAQLDALAIDNAADPVVQNITKILNDVIAVVNADGAGSKYSSTIDKAKDAVSKLAGEISVYRAQESKAADEKIRQSQIEFDNGAKELMARIQQEQRDQELRFREEYESEREKLAQSYEQKLKAEMDAAQKIADQKLRNELLEQNVKLTDQFTSSVRERVETERAARLSKLNKLSSDVSEIEQLTSKWGDVLDANLKTQHLVVAVDAVRAVLESADRPRPFVHELVALKEIAADDPAVNAAIASIDPSAYQKGIPTSAQLVDRFRRVAGEVRKASLLPEDAGAASHAASIFLSKLMFKKEGIAVGDDVESILTRTETLLEEGSLDDATREMNTLTGWAKVLSQDWLSDCRRVLEVRQALDVIATEARLQTLLVQ